MLIAHSIKLGPACQLHVVSDVITGLATKYDGVDHISTLVLPTLVYVQSPRPLIRSIHSQDHLTLWSGLAILYFPLSAS